MAGPRLSESNLNLQVTAPPMNYIDTKEFRGPENHSQNDIGTLPYGRDPYSPCHKDCCASEASLGLKKKKSDMPEVSHSTLTILTWLDQPPKRQENATSLWLAIFRFPPRPTPSPQCSTPTCSPCIPHCIMRCLGMGVSTEETL